MITNDHSDAVIIDRFFVEMSDGTFYGIDKWCIYDTDNLGTDLIAHTPISDNICGANTIYASFLGVDNHIPGGWAPKSQIGYFDMNQPDQYITDALWADGTTQTILQECSSNSATTTDPSQDPTIDPTADPTIDPTRDPTRDPTADPTSDPTRDPTADPSRDPTSDPTRDPTTDPTSDPIAS